MLVTLAGLFSFFLSFLALVVKCQSQTHVWWVVFFCVFVTVDPQVFISLSAVHLLLSQQCKCNRKTAGEKPTHRHKHDQRFESKNQHWCRIKSHTVMTEAAFGLEETLLAVSAIIKALVLSPSQPCDHPPNQTMPKDTVTAQSAHVMQFVLWWMTFCYETNNWVLKGIISVTAILWKTYLIAIDGLVVVALYWAFLILVGVFFSLLNNLNLQSLF